MSNSVSLFLDFSLEDGSTTVAARALSAAINAAPISSVLIRPAPEVNVEVSTATEELIALAQRHGIAALLPSNGDHQSLAGADGFHMPWSPEIVRTFKTLRKELPTAIFGADAGRSRHDAMELGEAGADYIAFGIPPHVEDRAKAAHRQRDLIGWWSELFEIPCVAFDVPDPEAAHELAAAGADFVVVHVKSTASEHDVASLVRAFSDALRVIEPAK